MSASRPLALAALLLTMLIWGSTFVVTKAAASEIPVLTLSFLRFLIAALALLPIALARGSLRRSPRMTVGALAILALTGMALFAIGFNYGLVFASATQGALIYALCPAAIAVAAIWVLHERPTRRRIVGIALSMAGVTLVIVAGDAPGHASPRPLLGAVCMLGAVVVWTVYTVLAKRLESEDQLGMITWVTLLAVAMLLPFSIIELARQPIAMPSAAAIWGAVFLGIAASSLAYVAYGYALRHLDATLVGVFTNLDPVIGVATAVLFLGERLHGGHVLGGALVLAGIWLASAGERVATDAAAQRHV